MVKRMAPNASTSAGVEPSAAAPAGDSPRRVHAARGVEDLGRLREREDAPEQRDLLAAQPARLPLAVPVLVERPDRLGGPGLLDEQGAHPRGPGGAGPQPRPRAL